MAPKVAKSVAISQFLPFDIVVEILSRLPVKSLVRFRCVCRQWNSLTDDPHFINKHLYRIPSCLSFICKKIEYNDIKLYDFVKDGTFAMHSSYKMRIKQQGVYVLSNKVHGLMCAYGLRYVDKDLILLNPFTREFAQLLPKTKNTKNSWQPDSFGFGYDVSTGKYKLVRLFLSRNFFPEYENQYCEILTVGSQEWRYLGKAPCRVGFGDAVYLDGAIYWIGVDLDVLSFDIKQEKFAIILGPLRTLTNCHGTPSYLYGSARHLYLIYTNDNCPYFKIWLMKDFATGLWINLYDINTTSVTKSPGFFKISSIEDEKVLLVHCKHHWTKPTYAFLSYDTRSKTFLTLYDDEDLYGWLELCSESLVSPRKLIGNVAPI